MKRAYRRPRPSHPERAKENAQPAHNVERAMTAWLQPLNTPADTSDVRLRLILFPHAGGSASAFRRLGAACRV